MTDETIRLLEMARRNVAEFETMPGFVAALVTGSVARGDADGASDIDTILYFDAPHPPGRLEEQKAIAEASGGGFYFGTPDEGFGVYRFVDGVKCDFGFDLVSGLETHIADVMERSDLDLDKQLILDGVRRAIVLRGEDRVAEWRRRTDEYPEALGRAMLEKHLPMPPAWVLVEMGAARGDAFHLIEEFTRIARHVLGMLCAVNRVYHPGKLKGARHTLDRLRLAPPDVADRLERLFTASAERAAFDAIRLVEETWALVEQEWPDVDLGAVRTRFSITLRRGASAPRRDPAPRSGTSSPPASSPGPAR
jgi:hypothetical protein